MLLLAAFLKVALLPQKGSGHPEGNRTGECMLAHGNAITYVVCFHMGKQKHRHIYANLITAPVSREQKRKRVWGLELEL